MRAEFQSRERSAGRFPRRGMQERTAGGADRRGVRVGWGQLVCPVEQCLREVTSGEGHHVCAGRESEGVKERGRGEKSD